MHAREEAEYNLEEALPTCVRGVPTAEDGRSRTGWRASAGSKSAEIDIQEWPEAVNYLS